MTQEPDSEVRASNSNCDPVFEQLVVNAEQNQIDRLTGIIAYAEWKLDYPSANLSKLDKRVQDRYIKEAERILLDFAGRYAENVIKDEVQRLLNEKEIPKELQLVESRLSSLVRANTIGYWTPVGQSLLASLLFTLFLFVSALAIRYAAPDSNAGRMVQCLFASDDYTCEIKTIPTK